MNVFESKPLHGWTRRPRLVASALGLAIASTTVLGAANASPRPTPGSVAPTDALLRIAVSDTIKDSDSLPTWIIERSLPAAKAQVPIREGQDQWIQVEIRGATYDYRVSAVAMLDGEPLGPMGKPVACVCSSDELLTLVDAQIAEATMALRAGPPRPSIASPLPPAWEPAPTTETVEEEMAKASDQRPAGLDADEPQLIGSLGHSGIGVGILGAATLGAGIGLVLRPDEFKRIDSMSYEYSTRRPGIGLAIGGGVALAAGTVMLVIGLVRRRKASTAILPSIGPRWATVSIARRF